MANLPEKPPCTIIIISRGSPLVILVVAGHGGCCNIFGILNNRLLSNPFWKLICGIIGWLPTGVIQLLPAVFIDMALLGTLVTSQIWLDRWTFSRATVIYTAVALEVNFIQSLVEKNLNGHSLWSILKDEFMKYPHKRKFCTLGAQYWRPRHSQGAQCLPILQRRDL